MDFTPIARHILASRVARTDSWDRQADDIQASQLAMLVRCGRDTLYGRQCRLHSLPQGRSLYHAFAEAVPIVSYDELRPWVMRMVQGEKDVLWQGRCKRFAQSSGTSDGKSKYIPVTAASLRLNHYRGSGDCVGHYLRANPSSRMFAGKGLILGGSFANGIDPSLVAKGVKIGDLSATLIDRIPSAASIFRVPGKQIALMEDWTKKLPAIAAAAVRCDITNISGVPSWFLTLLQKVLKDTGAQRITDVWQNLEVFFHGGISFVPYRAEYERLCDMTRMHFVETYNASEGFFASAVNPGDREMLLMIDGGIFYEFAEPGSDTAVPLREVQKGKIYEMIITACNGLWRYRLGDTVRIHNTAPVTVSVAGRTKSYINAFGEEVMEYNADDAIAAACACTGAQVRNYTVAPVYATDGQRGCHQWVIEWECRPMSETVFADALDRELQKVNSDYQAKRSHTIFLDPPLIVTVADGTFDRWLSRHGSGKLGGQRKIPRLSNDRTVAEQLGIDPSAGIRP